MMIKELIEAQRTGDIVSQNLRMQIVNLQKQVQVRRDQIINLQKQVQAKRTQIINLQKQVQAKRAAIATRKSQIANVKAAYLAESSAGEPFNNREWLENLVERVKKSAR